MKKTLLSLALGFLAMGATAQTLTGLDTAVEPAEGGLYYIYNVKAGKYLNTGFGYHNKQAGFADEGTPVKIVKNGSYYQFKSIEVGYNTYWGWAGPKPSDEDKTSYPDNCDPSDFEANPKYDNTYYMTSINPVDLVVAESDVVSNSYTIHLREGWGKTPYFTYVDGKNSMQLRNEVTDNGDIWQFIPYTNPLSTNLQSCPVMYGGQYNIYNVQQGKFLKGGEATKSGGNDFQFATSESDAWRIEIVKPNGKPGDYGFHQIGGEGKYFGWADGSTSTVKYPNLTNNWYYGFVKNNLKGEAEGFWFHDADYIDGAYYMEFNYGVKPWLSCTATDVLFTAKDNTPVGSNVFQLVNGIYPYTLKAEYGTLCVPFNATIADLDGLTAYEVESVEASSVNLTKATEIVAGKAYIVRGIADKTYNIVINKEEVKNPLASDNLKGVFKTTNVANGANNYLLQNGTSGLGFYPVQSDGLKIGANRCYLTLPDIPDSETRAVMLNFGGEETAIATVNGQSSNSQCFDLQGRRVAQMQKGGIYIVNGKKIINL